MSEMMQANFEIPFVHVMFFKINDDRTFCYESVKRGLRCGARKWGMLRRFACWRDYKRCCGGINICSVTLSSDSAEIEDTGA